MTSRRYKPDSAQCCERCVFGTGSHTLACMERIFAHLRSFADREMAARHESRRRRIKTACPTCDGAGSIDCEYTEGPYTAPCPDCAT